MLISLDYDGTYTVDPNFWDEFIRLAIFAGHEIIVVTMRYEAVEGDVVKYDLERKVKEIIFTGRQGKRKFLRNLNLVPDVWIDDQPEYILDPA